MLLHQANDHQITELYDYEGVTVFPPKEGIRESLVLWSDIMLTHLEYTNWTIQIGKIYKRPVVYISHNTGFEFYDCVKDNPEVAVIYNCHAMKAQSPFLNDSIVLHPSVDYRKFDVNNAPESSPYITMINCNENKGGKLLNRLARALPDRKFLAVKGSYEHQYIDDLPNITIRENGPDILSVYKQTRILIMPSRYESWGMTATEAMSNGIPVIACPTFGLKENCGDAGIFIPERGPIKEDEFTGRVLYDDGDSYDIQPMIDAIKKLDDKKYYKAVSNKCRRRAQELDPTKELENCESFLVALLHRYEDKRA